ncbi:hypothetical protein COV13_01405 [Candidatus Woesearchaeota archaeon CG10_big_fil_rev_8_21_14_0_10_32_9]|nr:MAG: hypothetical protein COV13_01405 [Candidatus Woesearchaeota archaeon CG10_big_fil_rev_8_21_14_0_10_32_9]
MVRLNTTKILLLFVLLSGLLLLTGCGIGDMRGQCSEGDACTYYTGMNGILLQQESAPRMLYYRTADLTSSDGNVAEFSIRLRNDGASDSYGAVFLSGFGPELFSIYKYKDGVEQEIMIDRANTANCYFNLLGFSGNSLGFTAGCLTYGVSGYSGTSGNWGLNLDLDKLGQLFGTKFPAIGVNLENLGDGRYNFGLSANGVLINILNHGALLMSIAQNFDFDKFGGSEFALKGDNPDSPGGDIDFKTFKVRMKSDWPAGQDYFNVPYQIKTCYAYTTFVSPMLCIDPDPFSDEDKVCRAETYTWGGSQGGPVAVTRLEQTNTGREMILDFTIRNVGSGRVWDVGYLEACSPYYPGSVKPTMLNIVYIGQAFVGETPIDCSRNYQIRLDPNTQDARFTCRYPLDESGNVGSAYAIPLKMELWYGYEETYNNQITIRRLS